MSKTQKYTSGKEHADYVTRRKVSHGLIETADRVRKAENKKELDLEAKRIGLLKKIDVASLSESLRLPNDLKAYQQLILIIGHLNLKTTTEVCLACKKCGYKGSLNKSSVKMLLKYRDLFRYDHENKFWKLTNNGDNEFARLKIFI